MNELNKMILIHTDHFELLKKSSGLSHAVGVVISKHVIM